MPADARRPVALVTGATGFIGTHLTARLEAEGFDVHAIVPVDGRPNSARVTTHTLDGTTDRVIAIVSGVAPDVVFHLASLFVAEHETAQVTPLVEANVLFGTQVLEAMAISGVERFVNTSTAWQHYGDAEYDPTSLYAATKQAFEDVLAFYVPAKGMRAVTLELYDTYGPDDPRPKLFAALRSAVADGRELAISPGEQMIDLVYIDDVVDAFLGAGEQTAVQQAGTHERYAVATGSPQSLRDIVTLWSSVTDCALRVKWGGRPYRAREMMAPPTRGVPLPGWSAKVALPEGISRMEGLA
jgi:nucleoside-diphosphate-sugar epimerase